MGPYIINLKTPIEALKAFAVYSPQVCKRWKDLLDDPTSIAVLSESLAVDFGHELITSVGPSKTLIPTPCLQN